MLRFLLADALAGMHHRLGNDRFITDVRTAVKKVAVSGVRQRTVQLGVRSPYEKVLDKIKKGLAPTNDDFLRLAHAILLLEVPVELILEHYPWSNVAGSEVVVAVAEKLSEHAILSRRRIDECDDGAIATVHFIVNRLFQGCPFHVELIPDDLNKEEALATLGRLKRRANCGVLVVIGSDQANPLAAAAANSIAGDSPLPLQFRWTNPKRPSSMSEVDSCSPDQAGIREKNIDDNLLYRDLDAFIKDNLNEHHRNRNHYFRDCGLLLIDCSSTPMLIVVSGHGGFGTRACVDVLWDEKETINRRLLQSCDPELKEKLGAPIGEMRLLEPVVVTLKKKRQDLRYEFDIETAKLLWSSDGDDDEL